MYAAALGQRTARIKIGYAVAVVPLHHPLRLVEEIVWLSHLSEGRLLVGVGPGFSAYEFAAFGVPLGERHERLEEGLEIIRRALSQPSFSHAGRHWTIPPVTLTPRPYGASAPPILQACSSVEALRRAALEGRPVMLGLKSTREVAEYVSLYRALRAEVGRSPSQIDEEVAAFRVLRRVSIGRTDQEARAQATQALAWERRTAQRVHQPGSNADTAPTLADGSTSAHGPVIPGGCVGTPATVLEGLLEIRALGIRHVIAWMNFGDMPYPKVRLSMELMSRDVVPELAGLDPPGGAAARGRP